MVHHGSSFSKKQTLCSVSLFLTLGVPTKVKRMQEFTPQAKWEITRGTSICAGRWGCPLAIIQAQRAALTNISTIQAKDGCSAAKYLE